MRLLFAAGVAAASILLSGCDPGQMWLHRNDGIVEKYNEEHIEVNEDISQIHFLSRPDDDHMVMVTDPLLQETAVSRCYGTDTIYLMSSSYIDEEWGERYGKSHIIGHTKSIYGSYALKKIDLHTMTQTGSVDLLEALVSAGHAAQGFAADSFEGVSIYEDGKYGRKEPCICLPIADFSDMTDVNRKKLFIYPDSEHYEVDRFLALADRFGPETDSNQQASWKEELNEIRKDRFWRHHWMKFGGYEIPLDHVMRERYIYIGPVKREGMVIIQMYASVVDVNNPKLLEMFPELTDYTFQENELINIYIGGFPDNEEILSMIKILEDPS